MAIARHVIWESFSSSAIPCADTMAGLVDVIKWYMAGCQTSEGPTLNLLNIPDLHDLGVSSTGTPLLL